MQDVFLFIIGCICRYNHSAVCDRKENFAISKETIATAFAIRKMGGEVWIIVVKVNSLCILQEANQCPNIMIGVIFLTVSLLCG